MTRNEFICRHSKCRRLERYGSKKQGNTRNYLCLEADAFRMESVQEFERQEVPDDCPFRNLHEANQKAQV